MGEEKPDEELMGKRKSSPRLSTTLLMSIIQGYPKKRQAIPRQEIFFKPFCATNKDCGTITENRQEHDSGEFSV